MPPLHRHRVADYPYDVPAQHGLIEWNTPLRSSPTATTLSNQQIYGATLNLVTSNVSAGVAWHPSALANTPVANENLIGLYTFNGTNWVQQVVTGDLTTWSSGPGIGMLNSANWSGSSTFQCLPGLTVALLFLSCAATGVSLRGENGSVPGYQNGGQANTGYPWPSWFELGSGQTALPGSFAPASMSTSSIIPMFAGLK